MVGEGGGGLSDTQGAMEGKAEGTKVLLSIPLLLLFLLDG
jgi:hypothetical protein